jgi:hypothetical protein
MKAILGCLSLVSILLVTACSSVPVLKTERPLVENVIIISGKNVKQEIAEFIDKSELHQIEIINNTHYQITQVYRSALDNLCKTIKHRKSQQQGEFKACETNNQWKIVSHVIAEMKP